MAATLYRSLTIGRMWTLLEASTDFTDLVKQTRRITDTQEGWLRKLMLRAVGDFPIVQIEMGDNFSGGEIPIPTFAAEGAAFGAGASDDWAERRMSEFKLSFIYEKPGFDNQDALEMAAMEALEAGGRNLGYQPILKWGPWKARRSGTATIAEVQRPTTQITIPVTYEFAGTQLKPS